MLPTGTLIFLVTAAMVVPYLIISIVGGGTILESLTGGKISYELGGAIVALVVMGNVFFGGDARGGVGERAADGAVFELWVDCVCGDRHAFAARIYWHGAGDHDQPAQRPDPAGRPSIDLLHVGEIPRKSSSASC